MNKRVAVVLGALFLLFSVMIIGFAEANPPALSDWANAVSGISSLPYGTSILNMKLTGTGYGPQFIGFAKFNIPATPPGENIVSATLMADVCSNTGTGSVSVFLVTSAWSSSMLTGVNLPTTSSTASATTTISLATPRVYSWTVTSDVVSGKAANGWKFVDGATGSSESLDSLQLIIVYNLIPVPENEVGILLALATSFAVFYFMKKPQILFKRH